MRISKYRFIWGCIICVGLALSYGCKEEEGVLGGAHVGVYGAVLDHLGHGATAQPTPLFLYVPLLGGEEHLSLAIVQGLRDLGYRFQLTNEKVSLEELVDYLTFSKVTDLGSESYELETEILTVNPDRTMRGQKIRAKYLVQCNGANCKIAGETESEHSTLMPHLESDSAVPKIVW